MKLISKIKIEKFRSINKCKIENITDFNSLFGLNNSGKSNMLRALNLFFNNETDKGAGFDFDTDFHQSRSRQKKEIKISVEFILPQNFKFKKKLKPVETFLFQEGSDRKVKIQKIFTREYGFPERIFMNTKQVRDKDLRNIEKFLSLINFRYIPNRVLPVEIMRGEDNNIRKAIARKIKKLKINKQEIKQAIDTLSTEIQKTSQALIEPVSKALKTISQDRTSVELITPSNIEDLISSSGYFLDTNNIKVRDIYQGSGIQSLLMFHTLHLIDKDYAQQFGWKQATIWAVEEPESSLHFDLEAQLAMFLVQTVTKGNSRLQFFCTTHSNIFSQYSDNPVFIEKKDNETTCQNIESKDLPNIAIQTGISEYTYPLLFFPRKDIILCEGKIDVVFVKKTCELLGLNRSESHITCLSELTTENHKGGKRYY